MSDMSLDAISALLERKYARGEAQFRSADFRGAVHDLYTEDARYLTPRLQLLLGREEILAFFESLGGEIGEVKVFPLCLWGDPRGRVYQFCNTVRRAPGSGAISHAHYFAAFREVHGDWLCELEVVSAGHIDLATASRCAAAPRS